MCPSHDQEGSLIPARRKLLVVQSQATLRLGYAYALNHSSTVVETAATGAEALERISETHFDTVFLDLRMPGMDGIRVIETLRGGGNRVPVVLCTTLQHPNATRQALSLGVVDFLLKPALPAEIREVVEFILGPPRSRFGEAMRSARAGDVDGALRILEAPPEADAAETCWLKALRLMREVRQGEDNSMMEEELRACFPMLVFNRHRSTGTCDG